MKLKVPVKNLDMHWGGGLMALDGKLLARAKAALQERRINSEKLYERKLEKAYARAPVLRDFDYQIRASVSEFFSVALLPDSGARAEDIIRKNTRLQEQRRAALRVAGFREDYLDDEYHCKSCRDTGYIDTKMCSCLMDLYKDETRKSLSSLFKLGGETFETFNLSYYDNLQTSENAASPRAGMEIIYETCVEYARKFGKKSVNLFFIGAPGLGKTFLSASIARVVAENGFSVVYDMAKSIFSKFEDEQFSRRDDLDEVREEIKRYLECDLLIIDDLGSEMTTAFTVSALYEVINTRMITSRKTIVSSNLSIDELRQRYSQQIMSRIEGEYQMLTFRGSDIRKIRNSL